MTFIPYTDGVKAVFDVGPATGRWSNTLWFSLVFGQTWDPQGLADWLHTWYGNNVMPNLDDSFKLYGVTVYDMRSLNGPVYFSAGNDVPGGVVGDAALVNAALVVSFYSVNRGRSGRGRNYISGFGEADTSTNQVGNAVRVTNIETAYLNLMNTVQQNTGYVWDIASHQLNGVPLAEVNGQQVVRVAVRSALMGSQRRRIQRD